MYRSRQQIKRVIIIDILILIEFNPNKIVITHSLHTAESFFRS